MPQDYPLESSEVLSFTPESLKAIPNAPVFHLRAVTPRDKRFQRRMIIEEGFRSHPLATIRLEVLNGLKSLWSPEAYEQHSQIVKDYWQANDDFQLQAKDDPELEWSYDPEIEKAVQNLSQRVMQSWPPLRVMLADNAEYNQSMSALLGALIIKKVDGLDVTLHLDRGYLTLDCALAVEEALLAFEEQHASAYNLSPGTAGIELFVECGRRMKLDEDEEKNSASPSPSPMNQAPSTVTTSDVDGKSPAPARSKRTRKAA